MNLGTHGMAVQGYIALHNGTYQNPELLMHHGRIPYWLIALTLQSQLALLSAFKLSVVSCCGIVAVL